MAGLSKEGTRVGPQHASATPKIVDPNGKGALSTALGAGYYRLIGLEVTVAPAVNRVWALVNLGSGGREQSSLDVVAHHLILDRMYIHGDPQHDCFRCVALNSASSAVIDSPVTLRARTVQSEPRQEPWAPARCGSRASPISMGK